MLKKNRKNVDFADNLIKNIGTTKSLLVHTVLFVGIFSLNLLGLDFDHILLVLTTFLSIEAIYLAIFIQISVNRNTESLDEVEEDIEEIQGDVEEEDIHDKEVERTLQTIETRLNSLQEDLKVLKKKGLM
jgi:uncharacterized membrane protein